MRDDILIMCYEAQRENYKKLANNLDSDIFAKIMVKIEDTLRFYAYNPFLGEVSTSMARETISELQNLKNSGK